MQTRSSSSSSSSTHHQRSVPFCTICSRKRKITIIHLGSTGRAPIHPFKHAHAIHNIYLAVLTHVPIVHMVYQAHHLPSSNYIIDRILWPPLVAISISWMMSPAGHLVVIVGVVSSDNSLFVFQLSVAQWVMAIVSATTLIDEFH